MTTKVVYRNNKWTCAISFSPNSDSELYELVISNLQKSDHSSDQSSQEPDKIEVTIKSKLSLLKNEKSTSHIFKFVPAFFVRDKIVQLPFSGYSHINLVAKISTFSKSRLTVSTNVPSLVDVKKMKGNDLTEIYDIEKKVSVLDLDEFIDILQINNGNLYIQLYDPLTHQIEKIAIKFGPKKNQMSQICDNKKFFISKKLDGFSTNLFTLFLSLVLILSTCYYLYHKVHSSSPTFPTPVYKTPKSPVRSPSNISSFNPCRYFLPSIDLSNRSFDTDQTAPELKLLSTNTNESYLTRRTQL